MKKHWKIFTSITLLGAGALGGIVLGNSLEHHSHALLGEDVVETFSVTFDTTSFASASKVGNTYTAKAGSNGGASFSFVWTGSLTGSIKEAVIDANKKGLITSDYGDFQYPLQSMTANWSAGSWVRGFVDEAKGESDPATALSLKNGQTYDLASAGNYYSVGIGALSNNTVTITSLTLTYQCKRGGEAPSSSESSESSSSEESSTSSSTEESWTRVYSTDTSSTSVYQLTLNSDQSGNYRFYSTFGSDYTITFSWTLSGSTYTFTKGDGTEFSGSTNYYRCLFSSSHETNTGRVSGNSIYVTLYNSAGTAASNETAFALI